MFNFAVLMSTEWLHHNYRFNTLHDSLAWLDNHEGALRWFVGFNLVSLRMISFAMDYHWAALKTPAEVSKKKRKKALTRLRPRSATRARR